MIHQRPWLIVGLLLASTSFAVWGQSADVPRTPSSGIPPGSEALTFLTQAKTLLGEGRPSEAKEAARTAIRLTPMNMECWTIYDRAVEAEYVVRAREEKITPVVERDLKPVFSIDKVESYMEFNSLYVVGEIRNVSDKLHHRIELACILLDENNRELRRNVGGIRLPDRGLFPSENSLFEIEFTNPPPGVKAFRVKVLNYE